MDEGDNSDTSGVGGKLNVMKLTDEEFENLSEEELAELRGDNL